MSGKTLQRLTTRRAVKEELERRIQELKERDITLPKLAEAAVPRGLRSDARAAVRREYVQIAFRFLNKLIKDENASGTITDYWLVPFTQEHVDAGFEPPKNETEARRRLPGGRGRGVRRPTVGVHVTPVGEAAGDLMYTTWQQHFAAVRKGVDGWHNANVMNQAEKGIAVTTLREINRPAITESLRETIVVAERMLSPRQVRVLQERAQRRSFNPPRLTDGSEAA